MGNRIEKAPRKISRRTLLSLGLKGAAVAGVATLGINCGGGDNAKSTPDDIKNPTGTALRTESPMPSQTAMATQLTESPTPEPTIPVVTAPPSPTVRPTQESTKTPEVTPNVIPEVNPLAQVGRVIADVQNVDGSFNPGQWEVQKSAILDGEYPDERGMPGLYDIQVAIENGNWSLALQRITDPFVWRSISTPLFTVSWEDEPFITHDTNPDNEIFKYDIRQRFIGAGTRLPANRLQPIKDFLILYYNMPQ